MNSDRSDFNLRLGRPRVRLIQFLNESSAGSPESGLYFDWPKHNRPLGACLRLVTELLKNQLKANQIMAFEEDLKRNDV